MRRGDPFGAPRRARRPGSGAARRRDGPSPHRGPRAAPPPGDGAPLPASGPVRRTQRPTGCQRRTRRLRAGLPVGRAAPVRARRAAARCRPGQRDPAGRAWVLLARDFGRGDARRDPGREDGHRAAQRRDAADARRELHPRRRHRPRDRGGRTALRVHQRADRRRRAPDRRVRGRADPRRRDAPAGDRRHPVRHRAGPDAPQGPRASTPRCSPTRSSTWSRPAS